MRSNEITHTQMNLQLVRIERSRQAELERWVEAYFQHDGLRFDAAVRDGIRELLEHPEYGVAWTILRDGVEVGYCVMTYGFDHEVGGRTGVVTDFYLSEHARGQGIGSRVLDLMTEHARGTGLRQVELFVLDHNNGARRLYERKGFRAVTGREILALRMDADAEAPSYVIQD